MKNLKLILLFVAISGTIFGAAGPYASLQYTDAFDQTALYEKYRPLMEKLGCAQNVFQSDADSITIDSDSTTSSAISENEEKEDFDIGIELKAFQKECLDQLNRARRFALAGPMLNSFGDIAFSGVATAAIMAFIGGTVASGFSGMDLIYKTIFGLKDTVKGSYNLIYWPENSLHSLENHYALNKCFIPRALWPKITTEFIAARQNEVSRQQHIYFIDFALAFTVYKPKPALQLKNNMSLAEVKVELKKRIDQFFAQYSDQKDINYIKINVAKFIDVLAADRSSLSKVSMPRSIYLFGSGGIGKTHFVQTLASWIDELMPKSVGFEDLVINSPDDLEGSAGYPGAFLKILRNQLLQNRRGSVVIIDEATWLNYGSMISSAKRIFNGDRSKLVTSYFGSNMDGTGVSLEIPPMLIFVAANEEIIDPALKSRFDTVYYPMPMDKALIDYAYAAAAKSKMLQESEHQIDKKVITDWVEHLPAQDRNFRYVSGNVESMLLKN